MKYLKVSVLIVMLLSMLFVWPIHPFREVTAVRSGDEEHRLTAPLAVGDSVTQYFRMPENNIISLEFVLTNEAGEIGKGDLKFELLDAGGNVVNEQILDGAEIPDYGYNGVILNLRTGRGAMYAYRLTNLSISDNPPCVVYVTDTKMQCLKKANFSVAGKAGNDVGTEREQGEILTRLEMNSPISADNTIAIWGCIAMVGFTICELIDRAKGAKVSKAQGAQADDEPEKKEKKG